VGSDVLVGRGVSAAGGEVLGEAGALALGEASRPRMTINKRNTASKPIVAEDSEDVRAFFLIAASDSNPGIYLLLHIFPILQCLQDVSRKSVWTA
jgi:hypothetical protein